MMTLNLQLDKYLPPICYSDIAFLSKWFSRVVKNMERISRVSDCWGKNYESSTIYIDEALVIRSSQEGREV